MKSTNQVLSKSVFLHNFLFYFLIFSLAFLQPFVFFAGLRLPITDFIFIVFGASFFFLLIFSKVSFRWHRFYWFLFIYLLIIGLSTAFSFEIYQNGVKSLGSIYLAILAVLTFNAVRTPQDFRNVAYVWLSATFVVCTIGIVSIILFYYQPDNWILTYTQYHYGAVPVGNYPRINSMSISASMFCNYLTVSLAFLLILKANDQIGKLLFFLLFSLIVINSIFTISSGFGAIGIVLGVWFWYYFRPRFPKTARFSILAGMAFSLFFLCLSFVALQEYPTVPFVWHIPFTELSIYPSSRYLVWEASLRTFLENPLLGAGAGQASSNIVFQNTDGTNSLLIDAHNIYLSVASRIGIFGLLSIIAIIYVLIREVFPVCRNQSDQNNIGFGLGLAFVAAFVYQGLLGSFEETRHLWVLVGLILSFGRTKLMEVKVE